MHRNGRDLTFNVFSLSLECFWFAQGQVMQEPYLRMIPYASSSYLGTSINNILS